MEKLDENTLRQKNKTKSYSNIKKMDFNKKKYEILKETENQNKIIEKQVDTFIENINSNYKFNSRK
jgi:hypothetical protein